MTVGKIKFQPLSDRELTDVLGEVSWEELLKRILVPMALEERSREHQGPNHAQWLR